MSHDHEGSTAAGVFMGLSMFTLMIITTVILVAAIFVAVWWQPWVAADNDGGSSGGGTSAPSSLHMPAESAWVGIAV